MKAKIIQTEEEYEKALAYVETLMDAEPGSPEEEDLALFSHLIEKYEEEHDPIPPPDPIEAILFRMDQEGLTRKDLEKYLGGQSRVSEVLNGKRSLSLSMIRALNAGLGIPAKVLLQKPVQKKGARSPKYEGFPIKEMFQRGYFSPAYASVREVRAAYVTALDDLFAAIGGRMPEQVYCRGGEQEVDFKALSAWQAKVVERAMEEELPPFDRGLLGRDYLEEVAGLSYYSTGPRMAKELLNRKGFHLIFLRHLPKTYLDGACFFTPAGHPVVGMTLRYDRLDNFWFTLLHELAHLMLHFDSQNIAYFDNTEEPVAGENEPIEEEADAMARDLLIPPEAWEGERGELLRASSAEKLRGFAESIQRHPAIVAGRVRQATGNYRRFSKLVGSGKVREAFPEFEEEVAGGG